MTRRKRARDEESSSAAVDGAALVVGYIRVSDGEKQLLSPEAQRVAIEAWAKGRGATLAAVHEDALSGDATREFESKLVGGVVETRLDLRRRPALLEAIADCKRRGATVLVAFKRDRFFRESEAMRQLERLLAPCRIAASDLDLDGLGSAGRIVASVTDAAAEHELVQLRSRTREALGSKRAQGQRVGGVPYGWRDPEAHLKPQDRDQTRKLVEVPDEQAIITKVIAWHLEELGGRAICSKLTAAGIAPRGARWHPQTIARIVEHNIERAKEAS
jgi:DNA invertase Pin-like site-specific DNA recombinase